LIFPHVPINDVVLKTDPPWLGLFSPSCTSITFENENRLCLEVLTRMILDIHGQEGVPQSIGGMYRQANKLPRVTSAAMGAWRETGREWTNDPPHLPKHTHKLSCPPLDKYCPMWLDCQHHILFHTKVKENLPAYWCWSEFLCKNKRKLA
jgi:hypothetical protein